jgi:hypothetical protein
MTASMKASARRSAGLPAWSLQLCLICVLIHLPDTAFAQQPARAFFVSVSPSVVTVPADYHIG